MEQFPQRNSETSWVTPTYGTTEKIPTLKWVGKVETLSHHKPQPCTSGNHEGTSNFQLFPEKQRIWKIQLVPQVSNLPPKGWPSNHLALKAYKTCIHESHKTISKKKQLLMGTRHFYGFPLELSTEDRGKNAHLPVLSRKGFDCRLTATYLCAEWEFPQGLKEPVGVSSTFSFGWMPTINQVPRVSLGGVCPHI